MNTISVLTGIGIFFFKEFLEEIKNSFDIFWIIDIDWILSDVNS